MLLLRIRQPPQTTRSLLTLRQCALRPVLRKSFPYQRCSLRRPFASAPPPTGPRAVTPPKPSVAGGSARAGSAQLPERLLIYHAGTGRTAFLAFWKITAVFSCAFFCLVAAPSYVRAEDKTLTQAAGLAACGIIPFLFVSYTSAPFVTYIYLRLPPYARQSRTLLERYVRALPPTAQLELGTMGLATRPRTTLVTAAELRPVPAAGAGAGTLATRFGIVTHTKDVSALMAQRKWYHYRPVGQFGINTGLETSRKSSSGGGGKGVSHGVKDGWVWNIVRESLGKRK
ncbi:hypothetical protein CORC01_10991 [Colletotrichum orchidophilum]|uniref:Uncharacterized protein n=1 Tax=Colletotrichum orchidophilum TaxID=1209926 RepID=A0A1G4AX09_9PEZI|nr:uncharacterized protein CORC01_10991 [Colletotrichum orchidophilum]OHE93674.1 hypothetical protein CORC01_10991 [Colletotrichum orchidophilum]